jgi:hypothetical protein
MLKSEGANYADESKDSDLLLGRRHAAGKNLKGDGLHSEGWI